MCLWSTINLLLYWINGYISPSISGVSSHLTCVWTCSHRKFMCVWGGGLTSWHSAMPLVMWTVHYLTVWYLKCINVLCEQPPFQDLRSPVQGRGGENLKPATFGSCKALCPFPCFPLNNLWGWRHIVSLLSVNTFVFWKYDGRECGALSFIPFSQLQYKDGSDPLTGK